MSVFLPYILTFIFWTLEKEETLPPPRDNDQQVSIGGSSCTPMSPWLASTDAVL